MSHDTSKPTPTLLLFLYVLFCFRFFSFPFYFILFIFYLSPPVKYFIFSTPKTISSSQSPFAIPSLRWALHLVSRIMVHLFFQSPCSNMGHTTNFHDLVQWLCPSHFFQMISSFFNPHWVFSGPTQLFGVLRFQNIMDESNIISIKLITYSRSWAFCLRNCIGFEAKSLDILWVYSPLSLSKVCILMLLDPLIEIKKVLN